MSPSINPMLIDNDDSSLRTREIESKNQTINIVMVDYENQIDDINLRN